MNPDSKVHGANMGPNWVLSSPGGPHVGPMYLAIWELNTCALAHWSHMVLVSIWLLEPIQDCGENNKI